MMIIDDDDEIRERRASVGVGMPWGGGGGHGSPEGLPNVVDVPRGHALASGVAKLMRREDPRSMVAGPDTDSAATQGDRGARTRHR
jgi:hypothetical protein